MADEEVEPRITITPSGAEYIRKMGGRLYVWADGAGMMRQRCRKPPGRFEWDEYERSGVRLFFDRSIVEAKTWTIDVRWFPWRRLDVLRDHVPPSVLPDIAALIP